MVDGYLWQGLKLDGNLNVTKYQPGMGLRYVTGSDPAISSTDYFSLGQGSPQVWEPNVYAAGTAACEIRIVKSTRFSEHARSAPDDGPHRLRDVGLDLGPERQPNGGQGTHQSVLDRRKHVAARDGLYGDPSTGSNPAGGTGPTSFAQLATFCVAVADSW